MMQLIRVVLVFCGALSASLVSLAFQPLREDIRRLSMYPEECSADCQTTTVVDMMVKPGLSCPQTLDEGNQLDVFIGSIQKICKTKVRTVRLRLHKLRL